MRLVERVKKIIIEPKAEWLAIDAEKMTVHDVFTQYVVPLAAIPAVALFVGNSIFGWPYRIAIGSGIALMLLRYLLILAGIYVFALLIDYFAPKFGATRNLEQAVKLSAFSATPLFVTGIFHVVPYFSVLAVLGLYGLWLLYLGLPVLMKVPHESEEDVNEKLNPYMFIALLSALVVAVVISAVSMLMIPGPARGF